MDISRIKPDDSRAEGGVSFNLDLTTTVTVASIDSRRFLQIREDLFRPHRRQETKGTLDPLLERDLMAQAVADGLLLGWDGLTDGGKPFQYSSEAARQLCKASTEFTMRVLGFAQDTAAFKAAKVEAIKNA